MSSIEKIQWGGRWGHEVEGVSVKQSGLARPH